MKHLLKLLCTLIVSFHQTVAIADTWIDEDGNTFIVIENGMLSIYSTNSFYYFDELFTDVRKGAELRLCLGIKTGTGMASDCVGQFTPVPGFNNAGKTRSLHFDVGHLPFIMKAFEDYLSKGETMKLSIDNLDLFSAYSLNADYKLNSEALNTLNLSD